MKKLLICTLLVGLGTAILTTLGTLTHAKDTTYIGTVETLGHSNDLTARGTVFIDTNRNSKRDADESGIAGVMVSNGREVTLTKADGSYALPAYGDMNLFITKPAGHTTPVDTDMIPQFAYIHKEKGSPKLRFGGIAPTGPLPAEINFPLIADSSGNAFDCLIFGDAQPYHGR